MTADNQRVILLEEMINAPQEEVWRAWTTEEGVKSFFCEAARIEPHVGGAYEIYFSLDAPEGSRGSEGCRILEYDAPWKMVFSWNFPPSIPAIRFEYTRVELWVVPLSDTVSEVRITQTGWKPGPDWDEGYAYFERAWGKVLHWLKQYFDGQTPDSKRRPAAS